ncbi:UNC93-like protein MFSD11 [Protopterus annectens]|uniref:UNC93-like protein MFSD11 n=1 Tax=Protopterus annectens TaxID=7888 RepID=UPI001CFB4BCD|nr:UNC93-like protein MFSD11 [Protopterus annectens]XP_043946427.1 UNC93-like protein MFSD11 [Protopterus annectens]XP_043946428.1 UNC93-like protein MFSD11 [Protopterus annectens]
MSPEWKKLLNIIVLGFGFMFMFTAFQTCGNIEQTVILSLNSTEFHGSGYTSLAIIYGVFSASNIFAPSVVAVLGARLSLFISGLFYSAYIATFIQPFTWSFYTASVFIGMAAAVLWTAQGNCLTVNSKENTIGRNSGIFWALLQCSLFFGNVFIYIIWHGEARITDSDRRTVFISLTVVSLVGTFLFFLIRNVDSMENNSDCSDSDSRSLEINMIPQSAGSKALEAFKKSAKLSISKEMLLLSISMAYTGVELTFFSGVYGTCIGAMKQFGNEAKGLIGLSGIFIGIGEILGGGLFGLLDKWNRYGRNPVVLLGLAVHFIAFYLIFFNIPGDAPIASADGTDRISFMTPNKEVAMLCSFLLGLGDSCFNTQLISILGSLFSESSAPAFAIFKFVQSICAAVAFFYSNYLLLEWQLLILVIFGFFGTISFFFVEWNAATVSHSSDFSNCQPTN